MNGVWPWLFHRITGIILLAGLTIHLYIMHFSGQEQISYEFVRARILNPYWKTFNIVFLISAVYHGFYGMWGIATEYSVSRKVKSLIPALACLLIITGIYIIII